MRAHAVRLALAAAAIAGMTLVLWPLRRIAPDVSLGALYTIVVLAAAAAWGLRYAIGVSIASLLVFNFFFLPAARPGSRSSRHEGGSTPSSRSSGSCPAARATS